MIQPMKFWEVMSAFREMDDILEAVFREHPWRDVYWESFLHFHHAVVCHDRQVLDAPVPLELSREIAARYPQSLFLDPEQHILRAVRSTSRYQELTMLEVHDQYGGAMIEEVMEYGSAVLSLDGDEQT